ncbi:hypothetical protein Tsubulata_025287 [Turnera subulata]|uniref:Uncharacterized protein n=1 Tax=Turnera subulata TaxID=218843 RepID=A0A9Q0FV73_9ROSI|nr:hypothetical protein Tsubulata_025287 [Turnera subulata]
MANTGLFSILYAVLVAAFVIRCYGSDRKVHIVYMGDRPKGGFSAASMHHSMLESVLGSATLAKDSIVYSYGRTFNGFAAKLSDEEVETFSEMDGVISVFPNRILQLHTTRSWDFMGFSSKSKLGASQEGDVIVGLLDTGIWPESESFNDEGMSPPPAKWKGKCVGANFTCNNKIIGARYYATDGDDYFDDSDIRSPRDSEGHGTHTSSTAAGREVAGVSYLGLAEGIARGAVPNARIAMYKVCWSYGCTDADILAAFDDAIADGVDILSVSLGSYLRSPFFEDTIAIGSFHAMKHGILTSNSAGNSGPHPYSVCNVAPWTLTVAASTIDRKFVAQIVLGNGQVLTGLSINNFELNGTSYPLIYGGDAANYSSGSDPELAARCYGGNLNSYKVSGKIVFCKYMDDGFGVRTAGGLGMIMVDAYSSFTDVAFSFSLPATAISVGDGQKVLDYIRSTNNPFGTIMVSDPWKDTMAPSVVSFSSRGPNLINPDILKPDLTAPGVDILAAWSPVAPPSIDYEDPRKVNFNIISGTSMSAPHASGAAAYVKAAHPSWSPAAVKSALMTTSTPIDPRKHNDLEFAYGSGHLNPAQAIDPGLVYDASEMDYINFLCKQGYNTTTVRMITGSNHSVCHSTKPGRAWDLNYPSFAVAVEDGKPITAVFARTVTNLGSPNSTYTVKVYKPAGSVSVTVKPSVLAFSSTDEKKTFTVKVSGPAIAQQPITSGAIIWSDGDHVVRSPLVVYNILPGQTYFKDYSMQRRVSQVEDPAIYRRNSVFGRSRIPI